MDTVSSKFVTEACTLQSENGPINALAWSPDQRWLATGTGVGALQVWSTTSLHKGGRPRFVRQKEAALQPASLAWSPQGDYLACGSLTGAYEIVESRRFQPVSSTALSVSGAIHCMDWGPATAEPALRLAIGCGDRKVHFKSFEGWKKNREEHGVGHISPVTSMAWSPNGDVVVSGTEYGTIGVWRPFETSFHQAEISERTSEASDLADLRDYYGSAARKYSRSYMVPLVHVLPNRGIHAHEESVTALHWSRHGKLLLSASWDGILALWNVEGNELVRSVALGDPIITAKFSHLDNFVVVQTLNRILFLTSDALVTVCEIPCQLTCDATFSPLHKSLDVDGGNRLAVRGANDPGLIKILSVNYEAMLAQSKGAKKAYRAVGVAVLGEALSGKTSLSRALLGLPFSAQHEAHGLSVHALALSPEPNQTPDHGKAFAEEKAILIWDTSSAVEKGVQHVHAADCAATVTTLKPSPGVHLLHPDNLQHWRRSIPRARAAGLGRSGKRPTHSYVAVTHKEHIHPDPTEAQIASLASALGTDKLFVVSAYSGQGISELRDAVTDDIDWDNATKIGSFDFLHQLEAFTDVLRQRQTMLMSLSELRESFLRSHLPEEEPVDDESLRDGLRLLELKGKIYFFERSDELILDPTYFHAYASSMVKGAQEDPAGMGRLPQLQASMGVGKQMNLDQAKMLATPRDHRRLLELVINELVSSRLAQWVCTDGMVYLVFPKSLTRVREGTARPDAATKYTVSGPVDDLFSALIVRLLGQRVHYPSEELWRHEARFIPAAGGGCGVAATPFDNGDRGAIEVFFDKGTESIEKNKFLELVREHIENYPGAYVEGVEMPEPPVQAEPALLGSSSSVESAQGARGKDVRAFISWRADADPLTADNARRIIDHLSAQNIHVSTSTQRQLGTLGREWGEQEEDATVAVVLLAKRPTKEHCLEFTRLETAGTRIIPVILPNASPSFSIPKELRQWGYLDFRGRFLDIEYISRGIRQAWEDGPVRRTTAPGHVFVSYFSEDRDTVAGLVDEIAGSGHNVWWDRGESRLPGGVDWEREISKAIADSYAFLICLSDRTRNSSWVYKELAVAMDRQDRLSKRNSFIIPIRLSECDVEAFFAEETGRRLRIQHVDYFGKHANTAKVVEALNRARTTLEAAPSIQL